MTLRLSSRTPAVLLLCLVLLPAGLSAQDNPARLKPGPATDPTPTTEPFLAAEPFDIAKIVPDTFQARALRIPEGMTPEIDGRLDDEVWTLAQASGNFYQREPDYGRPSSEKTEFRILYDDAKIYFGVWLWDSQASRIIASEMKRDSGLNRGDQLKIIIDTFHDHRNGFYFSTNPLGALKDANTVENGRTINYDWRRCRSSPAASSPAGADRIRSAS